jgi:ABC-type antimicrobial peptide transport system permease subunit
VVGVFAASALLLAAIGMYGIVAYSVAQRKKEIGIRIALGADARRVLGLVLRQTFKLLLTGLLVGLPLAAVVNPLFLSLLFEVTPSDPVTFSFRLPCCSRWRYWPAQPQRFALPA